MILTVVLPLYDQLKSEYPEVIFSLFGLELMMDGRTPRIEKKGTGEYWHIVCDEYYEVSGAAHGSVSITRSVAMVLGNKKHHVQQLEKILKELWSSYMMFI